MLKNKSACNNKNIVKIKNKRKLKSNDNHLLKKVFKTTLHICSKLPVSVRTAFFKRHLILSKAKRFHLSKETVPRKSV
jgi:hypothetical protein